MGKLFGLSKRRMKLGKLKVQLPESSQGAKSPTKHPKHSESDVSQGEGVAPGSGGSDDLNMPCSSSAEEDHNSVSGNLENWMALSISGDKPTPRSYHGATVIGNKMFVVGGESGNELLEDVQVLHFDKFFWTMASSKQYFSPTNLPLKIPACKGHSLIPWGQKVLMIGGKMNPGSDRLSVWAFDTETECWSFMEAKGDIPVSRSGHTVVRAGSVLILFGGEDAKKKKLNDLHMFDLKSLMWLPLHCTGPGPSPRTNHVATLYDDRILLIFGGTSKSRTLNDLYSLDFETMVWSRIKTRGFHPSPRAGCCGVLCGTKWYIVGGGSRKKRYAETLVFDVIKVEWTLAITSSPSSVIANKGFSLVLVQHKEKDFLVAFGGYKKDLSNQVEALPMEKNELSTDLVSALKRGPRNFLSDDYSTGFTSQPNIFLSVDSEARKNLASAIEQHGSGRKSLSETLLVDSNSLTKNVQGHKHTRIDEEHAKSFNQAAQTRLKQSYNSGGKIVEETASVFDSESHNAHGQVNGNLGFNDEMVAYDSSGKTGVLTAPSSIYRFYEAKVATLIRKNGILEGQLAALLANREAADKNLSSALRSRQDMEQKMADTTKEMDLLKEKLAAIELAQEEANSLSSIVHSDNVRLEHDVAFLKAVLDDTQKELHSTRGVLSGERARAFQLQVEVFHLKQRMLTLESRAPTPRKPILRMNLQ